MRHPIAGLIFGVAAAWSLPAAASGADCEARADAVVAELVANAEQPLGEREQGLARAAALAGCDEGAGSEPSPEPTSEPTTARAQKPEMSASQRFWAGLFSSENKDIKTRAGGKYKYDAEKK